MAGVTTSHKSNAQTPFKQTLRKAEMMADSKGSFLPALRAWNGLATTRCRLTAQPKSDEELGRGRCSSPPTNATTSMHASWRTSPSTPWTLNGGGDQVRLQRRSGPSLHTLSPIGALSGGAKISVPGGCEVMIG
jgi:hypothetical protein